MNNHDPKSNKPLAILLYQAKMATVAKNKWLLGSLLRQVRCIVAQIGQQVRFGPAARRVLLSTATGALLLTASLAVPVLQANADGVITVTTTIDTIDANGGDCDGLSKSVLSGTVVSLREAVCAANTDDGVDTIMLPSNLNVITLTLTGSNEDLSATGDLDVITGTHVIIKGAGAGNTIIDGNATDRVFSVLPGATLDLSDVTIQNGNVTPPGNECGGGLLNTDATLIVSRSVITGNSATSCGGGIANQSISGQSHTTVSNSTISGNSTNTGGGLSNRSDGSGSTALITVTNSIVSHNLTLWRGGGIFNYGNYGESAQMTLVNSTISNNTASGTGGGISTRSYQSVVQATLLNSTVSGNHSDLDGGGIYSRAYYNASHVTLVNSTVSGNHSNLDGGGVYTKASSDVTATVSLTNSTITNNTANFDDDGFGDGGGIFVANDSGLEITTIHNSIVAGNFDKGGANIYPDGSGIITTAAYNLISNTSGISASFTNTISNTDPLLEPLANNGGTATASGEPPFTHALMKSSPAISAANTTVCADAPVNDLDQRGEKRGSVCDIGAYEFGVDVTPELNKIHLIPVGVDFLPHIPDLDKPEPKKK